MDSDELVCPLCRQYFNSQENTPRMLPSCGHTFCTKCIQDIMDKLPTNENFTCPEDRIPAIIEKKEANIFPKNYILLRLVDKKKNSLCFPMNKTKNEDNFNTNKTSIKCHDKPSLYNYSNKLDKFIPSSLASLSSIQDFRSPHNKPLAEITNFDPSIMCKEHNRRLEIVCMDHKCRICSNCALFGNHKNHDVRGEEEILKEITIRAEYILDMLQIVDENQHKIFNQAYYDKVNTRIKMKYDELTQILHQKFEEYIGIIKMKERKIMDEINQKFNILEVKFNEMRQLPKDIHDKIQKWKSSAQGQLTILSQKTEKHEIAFELLQDKYNIKGDIVYLGEKIMKELDRIIEIPIKSLEDILNSTSIIYNDNFNTQSENLAMFVSNISQDYTINWNIKNNLDSSPPRQSVGIIETSNISSNAKFNTASYSQAYSNEKKYEEDLLNFNLSNLSLVEIPEGSFLENSRKESPRSYLNFTPPVLMAFSEKPPKNPDSTSISANFERLPHHSEKSNIHHSVSPPGRLDTNAKKRDFSPITKKVESLNNSQDNQLNTPNKIPSMNDASKSNNKKKFNFKIAEKYESTIESMKSGVIENVDLTGAELGDIGMVFISDLISKSRGIKSLKLVKNKISDEGLQILTKVLMTNTSISNLNLTQNLLSDRSLDILISLFQNNKAIKKLYLNQNPINTRNSRTKLRELSLLGVEVYH